MDRLISYGGWSKPIHPTSNSEYGRGVLSSMKKAGGTGTTATFDPSAPNYYFPQVVTSSGGGQWQQPMGYANTSAQGHVHAPNCPRFGTGANTKYPMGNASGGMQYQIPGVGSGSDVVHTADHIEVLHGDAARAYLAQQNGGGGDDQAQQNYYTSNDGTAPGFGPQGGMTVSFQPVLGSQETTETAGNDATGNNVAAAATPEAATQKRQNETGDYVKVSGLPMARRQRWCQGNSPTISSHDVSSARNLRPTASSPAFKLCGRCSNCKNLDPASIRPSTAGVRPRPQMQTATGSQRFPIPRGIKAQAPVSHGQRIAATQGQRSAQPLPIQGETFSVNMASPGFGQQ